MTGIIVSSTIADVGGTQVDGRKYVTEHHTDLVGVVHSVTYLADSGADYNAILAANAAALEQSLPAAELQANIGQISTVYPPVVTLQYTTQAAVNAEVRTTYAGATALTAVLLGEYLSALADADLALAFGYASPSSELTALRNTLNAQSTLLLSGLTQRGQ